MPTAFGQLKSLVSAGGALAVVVALFVACALLLRRGGQKPTGVLPPESFDGAEEGDPPLSVEMRIVGSENGWLLIDRAAFPSYGDSPDRPVFSGRGWVSGRYVTFSVEDPKVRTAPSRSAPVVAEAREEEGEWINVRRVLSCAGAWAEVEAEVGASADDARRVRGFVRNICGDQLTTCGLGGM